MQKYKVKLLTTKWRRQY